jgi:hypothetical protein
MLTVMRNTIKILILSLIISSCSAKETEKRPVELADWKSNQTDIENFEDFVHGKTYLPVYSHIYHIHEHRTFDLTITVSIRNVSLTDTVYILKADYYNTIGENIRQYIRKPIFIKPLETLEIIIEEQDTEGGSGANFIFDWAKTKDKNPPLFEAVMISTYGQQGLSFTTRGVPVSE